MSEENNRPFTAEELDFEIDDSEECFRVCVRECKTAYHARQASEVERHFTNAAEIASVLGELRIQRERLT